MSDPLAPDPAAESRRAAARRSLSLPDEKLWLECDVETYVGGGPGGQHRNKTESAVRVRHRPTGIVVNAGERRSQLMNRDVALERLKEELRLLTVVAKPRKETRTPRSQKRRRLDDKKIHSQKKRDRRGDW